VVDAHLRVVQALEVNGRVEGARLHDEAIIDLSGPSPPGRRRPRQLRTFAALRDTTRATDAHAHAAAVHTAITDAAEHVRALATV
jgi:hypothetical protein